MNLRAWSILFLGGLGSLAMAASQDLTTAKERHLFSEPQISVPLLYGSDNAPVLATLAGDSLFYSSSFPKGDCLGKDLYRVLLSDPLRNEELVTKLDCVIALQSDGKHLVVMGYQEKGPPQWYGLKEGKLEVPQRAFSTLQAPLRWRLHQAETRTGIPWFSGTPELFAIHLSPSGVLATLLSHAANPTQLLFVAARADKRVSASAFAPKVDPKAKYLRNLAVDGKGICYLPFRTNGEKAAHITVWSCATGEPLPSLGGSDFYREAEPWTEAPAHGDGAIALRTPRVIGASHGIFIHDRTDLQSEWNSLIYFSADNNRFFRTKIPLELVNGVEGVSFGRGGFVLSQPSEGRVLWIGLTTPFDKQLFPPRDLQLRELPEEDESARKKKGVE